MDNLDHISEAVEDLAERGWAISLDEFKELRLNMYERTFLLPYLSVGALKYIVENNLHHCQRYSTATYDGYLQEVLVPELIRRLEQ